MFESILKRRLFYAQSAKDVLLDVPAGSGSGKPRLVASRPWAFGPVETTHGQNGTDRGYRAIDI
jgi:hypothetical protein